MIICKTPLRISFMGGGTDFSEFFNEYQGKVISATINKYMYVCLKKSYKEIFLKYSKFENEKHYKHLKHPIVRETLKFYNLNNVDIASFCDIPGGTGLGSSSAFTISLISTIQNLLKKKISKEKICKLSSEIEIKKLKSNVGYQDQYACCHGGLNKIIFNKNKVQVNKLKINKKIISNFNNHLFLLDTNMTRSASKILDDQKKNYKHNIPRLLEMLKLCDEFEYCLKNSKFKECGLLLNENWKLKKSLSKKISNDNLNLIYSEIIKSGVYGAKLLGAGAGGFFLCIANPSSIKKIKKKFKKFKIIDFKFDNDGSKVLTV
jgi:D-glycero-alpha-D-manno-heptose-7-phosphate kinase